MSPLPAEPLNTASSGSVSGTWTPPVDAGEPLGGNEASGADLLREAAADMRAKAEAATPGPWAKGEYHGRDIADEGYSYITVEAGKAEVASTYPPGRDDDPCEANAAHIASWHPAVALVVADWLDWVAQCREVIDAVATNVRARGREPQGPGKASQMFLDQESRAHAVARAYLGRDS